MTSATNLCVILSAVGASLPSAAAASEHELLSVTDREVLDFWRGRLKYFRIAQSDEVSEDESDRFGDLGCDCTHEIDRRIGSSVLALGAVLLIAIEDKEPEPVFGFYRACLRTIRPQLVGAIAEAADRVLAEEEEARA